MPTERRQIRVSREWLALQRELSPAAGRTIIIGGTDSGKSTLCRWLAEKLKPAGVTALVDADVGQSQIGPPGSVGWRLADSKAHEFFFVGDVTPVGHEAAVLAGLARAVRRAESAGAVSVVIDTTGYLRGPAALELKGAKLDLLAPLHVVLLGDSAEVRRLLAAWRGDPRLTIHRLAVTEVARQKTRRERCEWRQRLFASHLAGAELRTIALRGRALTGLPTARELAAAGRTWQDLRGLLLGFHDEQRLGLCLGLLQDVNLRQRELLVRARAAAQEAAGIIFGSLRLQPDGQSLPCASEPDLNPNEVQDGQADDR